MGSEQAIRVQNTAPLEHPQVLQPSWDLKLSPSW